MALTDIIRGERVVNVTYGMFYEWVDSPGAGYSFDCDKDGNLLSYNADSLAFVKANPDKFREPRIQTYRNSYWEPGHGKCPCGETVYLENDYGHGIDCDSCGRIYNQSGQELAPRSQWEDRYDEDSTQPYNVEFGYAGEDY